LTKKYPDEALVQKDGDEQIVHPVAQAVQLVLPET